MAQRTDLDMFSQMILRLSQAGMPLFPDADLEAYVRDTAGMPDAASDESYSEAQRQAAGGGATDKRARLEKAMRGRINRWIAKRKR